MGCSVRTAAGTLIVTWLLLGNSAAGDGFWSRLGNFGFNERVTLAGTVVDDRGEALDGVRLSVLKSRFALLNESFSRASDEQVVVDRSFEVDCRRCRSVRLEFDKKGYLSQQLDFSVRPDDDPRDDRGQRVDLRQIEVVLSRLQNPVRLRRVRGAIRTSAQGPRMVLPLGRTGSSIRRLDRLIADSAEEELSYVQLVATVDAQSRLAEARQLEVPGARFRKPATATLDFSHVGGVVVHKVAGQPRNIVYREMRAAPVDGYRDTIELKPEVEGDVYFYFRTPTAFGKGMVAQPSFAHLDGEEVVLAFVELRLNPDGSRNLETAN